MKQTAVELLEDGINKVLSHLPLEREDIKTIIQQAKAMEKQQIKDAWDNGIQWEWDSSIRNSEEYYNKTFKTE